MKIYAEGFGPKQIAVIVETLTDNKNRTASNIRTIFQKNGGSLGTKGSASHNFNQLGVIKIDREEISEEKIFDIAIEAGASDCILKKDIYEIRCEKDEIYNIKKKIEKDVQNFISTDIEWIPINNILIKDDQKNQVMEFLETLEDDDDVQNIFTNINFGDIDVNNRN